MSLTASLFGDDTVAALFSEPAQIQAMLDVEVALAEALATAGVVPRASLDAIRTAARADEYDAAAIAGEAARAGNAAIPLVRHFTAHVAAIDADAARYVHLGATSQDVLDTALVLQLRGALPRLLDLVERAAAAAARHAREHRHTPMPGRTWLQQATPTTFGLKAAGWLDALLRTRAAVVESAAAAFVLQFGGASGTLAALGEAAPAATRALSERLNLPAPDMPWHAHRDRIVRFACSIGVLAGSLGKIGRDLGLLAQTEVGEARDAASAGGSSAMPHKQNPVASAVAIAAAVRAPGLVATLLAAMPQEHERGLGGWPAEWEVIPELVILASGSARAVADALDGLVIDPARMAANLAITRGLSQSEAVVVALSPELGRAEAYAVVEAASRRAAAGHGSLEAALGEDVRVRRALAPEAIARCLDPTQYLGQADAYIDRALTAWRQLERERA